MSLSRRSLFRSLGLLSAGQAVSAFTLPAVTLLAGCRKQPKPLSKPIQVLFEGPWIFSHDPQIRDKNGHELLIATTIGAKVDQIDATHTCQVGNPDKTSLKNPITTAPTGSVLTLGECSPWTFAFGKRDMEPDTFPNVVGKAFQMLSGIVLSPKSGTSAIVVPKPPFRQVILPMPDSVRLAAKSPGIKLLDPTNTDPTKQDTGMRPFVTTIIEYFYGDHITANIPNAIPSQSESTLLVDNGAPLVFRMTYDSNEMKAQSSHSMSEGCDHPTCVWNDLGRHLPNHNRLALKTLDAGSPKWERDVVVTSFGTDTLGLTPCQELYFEGVCPNYGGLPDCVMGGAAAM